MANIEDDADFFRDLIDNAPDAVFWIRQDGSFAYVNKAACQYLGYSLPELRALSLFDVDVDLDTQFWAEHWAASREEDLVRLWRRHGHKSGQVIPVVVLVRPTIWQGEDIRACFVRDLTEQKRLEAIQASHQGFDRALFHESPAPQLILDPEDGAIVDANSAAERFYGYERAVLLSQYMHQITQLCPKALQAETARATRQEKSHFELRHRLATGEVRDVHVFSGPIERDGRTLLHSTVQDVTPMLEAQRQLLKYRDQLERLPVGVYRNTPGPNGVFLWVNGELARMMDAEAPGDLIGRRVADFYAEPDQREAFSQWLDTHGEVYRTQLQLVTLAQRRIRVAITARRIVDRAEGVVFEGAVEDITHEYEQAERLRQADAVIEHAHEGITITDADRNILRVNKAFTSITGYRPEEAIGRNPRMLSSGLQDASFYRALWDRLHATGHWQGEIWNRRKDGTLYPQLLSISAISDESGDIVNYVGLFTDLTELKQVEANLQRLTDFDALTGLPNRKHLFDTLRRLLPQCRGGRQALVVMACGFDHFRHINQVWSPEFGDEVLGTVADRLVSALPQDLQAFRTDSDVFAIVGMGRRSQHVIGRMSAAIDDAIHEPISIGTDERIRVQLTRGSVTTRDPSAGAESLLANADAAMLHAKRHHRGGHIAYSERLSEDAREHLVIESELRRALVAEEFTVALQPIVTVDGNLPEAVEALARWPHPTQGMIPPDRFIPVAEASGLIGELSIALLARACAATRELSRSVGIDLRLAFNVSASLISDANFMGRLLQTAQASGLALDHLELEITESLLMQQPETVTATLAELTEAGVQISIDDFGTGYSSLAYLQELDADTLKIDRRFIGRVTDSAKGASLVASIIAMAGALGMRVVAEGVETEGQLEFLRQHRCDCYQGYLFSRPNSPADLTASLTERRKSTRITSAR